MASAIRPGASDPARRAAILAAAAEVARKDGVDVGAVPVARREGFVAEVARQAGVDAGDVREALVAVWSRTNETRGGELRAFAATKRALADGIASAQPGAGNVLSTRLAAMAGKGASPVRLEPQRFVTAAGYSVEVDRPVNGWQHLEVSRRTPGAGFEGEAQLSIDLERDGSVDVRGYAIEHHADGVDERVLTRAEVDALLADVLKDRTAARVLGGVLSQ